MLLTDPLTWAMHNLDLVGIIGTTTGNLMLATADDVSKAQRVLLALMVMMSVAIVVALRGNPGPY
jgi:hypothetical protein